MADYAPLESPVHDPQKLPVDAPEKLIGRDALLAKIYNDLKKDDAVLIFGEAGVGKTALAATLAAAYSELPGGVIWLNGGDTTLPEYCIQIARAYGRIDIANSDNPLMHSTAIKGLLDEHKPLVVIDGDPEPNALEHFVEEIADGVPLLITADEPLDGPWTSIELPALNHEQAVALFRQIAGNGSDEDIQKLLDVLGSSPYAVCIAAGALRATQQPIGDYLAALPKAPGAAPPALLLALTAAFRGLPNALQGLMLMLGATFRGEGSGELLSMISGAPVEGVNQAMQMLVSRRLVERFPRAGSTYYRLHPQVKEFAESWLRGSQRLDALQSKVRDSVVAYASRFATQPARLAAEIPNILATAQWAAEGEDLDTPNQLAVSIMQAGSFIAEHGYSHELTLLRRLAASPGSTPFPAYQSPLPPAASVMPIAAPPVDSEFDDDIDEDFDDDFDSEEFDALEEADEDIEDDDEAFDNELDEDTLLGDGLDEDLPIARPLPFDDAPPPLSEADGDLTRLRATLMQARQQGDQRRQAAALKEIAALQLQDGMDNEALSTYAEALTHFEAVNDRGEILNVLQTLAELEVRTDNLQAAALHAARGASIADQLGETHRQALLLVILGDARQQLGEAETAIRAYEQGLALVRATNDTRSEAVMLFKLGYAQLDDNQTEAASETWETALSMFKTQGRRDYEGRVLGGLGTAYGDMERWTESVSFHTSALYIAREVGDRREEALQLTNLGFAHTQARQLGDALLRYRQALHLAYKFGERDEIVSTSVEIGTLLLQSARHLSIASLVVDEALTIDPNDRDLRKLKERIATDRVDAEARGVVFISVEGSAQDYARNAYDLLNET
jgi:tetratricopeptide (TPR) repeat protein